MSSAELSDTDVGVIAFVAFGVGFAAAKRSHNWKRGLLAGVCALPAAMFGGGVLMAALEDMEETDE